MRKFVIVFLISFLSPNVVSSQTNTERAQLFLKQLERERFDSCFLNFDAVLASKVSEEMLAKMWMQFPTYFGNYSGPGEISSEMKDTLEKVKLLLNFEKVKIKLSLVYAPNKKIVGILFVPASSENSYQLPAYAKLGTYAEKKLVVESGDYKLPGILCLPNQIEYPPVVILLAGSGPQDKDESIGPNKVLKDMATGLASKGVASLRYDKRTLVYGEDLKSKADKIGIEQEVIEDAVNAVKLILKQEETINSKVVVLGHSLGGMCAPYVAQKSGKVNAIIMLAANARPLEELILEQYHYIFSLDSIDQQEQSELNKLGRQIHRLQEEKVLKKSPADSLPLGLNAFYWQSLKRYDQVAMAKKLKEPILVLQGGRDYQVTLRDFDIWKRELSMDDKNSLKVFEELNHLFIEGEGKSTPMDYQKSGNVQEEVISTIADWVKGLK